VPDIVRSNAEGASIFFVPCLSVSSVSVGFVGINNLRVCNGLYGLIPTAPTMQLIDVQ